VAAHSRSAFTLCSAASALADKRLFKWLIARHRPFHLVDDSEFHEFLSTFVYKPPSRPFVMNMLVTAHSDVEDQMAKLFTEVDAVGICSDFWTNSGQDSIYGITAHGITKDFKMFCSVLRCCQSAGELHRYSSPAQTQVGRRSHCGRRGPADAGLSGGVRLVDQDCWVHNG
jgi:hypothetical protein